MGARSGLNAMTSKKVKADPKILFSVKTKLNFLEI
jgi:hypothetical protein